MRLPRSREIVTQSFDELADRLDREEDMTIRVQCVDGRVVVGRVIDVAQADLLVLDETSGEETPVSVGELRTVDLVRTHHIHEWMLALVVIPAVIVALVAIAQLPWIREMDNLIVSFAGLLILFVLGCGLVRLPRVKPALHEWVTRSQRLYSSTEGTHST